MMMNIILVDFLSQFVHGLIDHLLELDVKNKHFSPQQQSLLK